MTCFFLGGGDRKGVRFVSVVRPTFALATHPPLQFCSPRGIEGWVDTHRPAGPHAEGPPPRQDEGVRQCVSRPRLQGHLRLPSGPKFFLPASSFSSQMGAMKGSLESFAGWLDLRITPRAASAPEGRGPSSGGSGGGGGGSWGEAQGLLVLIEALTPALR